jgi:hypothetical protein
MTFIILSFRQRTSAAGRLFIEATSEGGRDRHSEPGYQLVTGSVSGTDERNWGSAEVGQAG